MIIHAFLFWSSYIVLALYSVHMKTLLLVSIAALSGQVEGSMMGMGLTMMTSVMPPELRGLTGTLANVAMAQANKRRVSLRLSRTVPITDGFAYVEANPNLRHSKSKVKQYPPKSAQTIRKWAADHDKWPSKPLCESISAEPKYYM